MLCGLGQLWVVDSLGRLVVPSSIPIDHRRFFWTWRLLHHFVHREDVEDRDAIYSIEQFTMPERELVLFRFYNLQCLTCNSKTAI